jgi:AcrR family transcriptional regulator
MSQGPDAERPSRAERSEATRARLVDAAVPLFAERGYGGVAMEQVVAAAGVTRGALYHHFRDKRDLFRAVYEASETEMMRRTVAALANVEDPWEELVAGIHAWLDACADPALRRISLVDAPAVLGWAEWREIGNGHALGLVTAALQGAMDGGALRRAEVEPLAHLVLAALAEAAMLVATADDPEAARPEVEQTVVALLSGLRAA